MIKILTDDDLYTLGYTDYLDGSDMLRNEPAYIEGYLHQKYCTEVLEI